MAKNEAVWKRDTQNFAHLIIQKGCISRPRCGTQNKVLTKAKRVSPPVNGDEAAYCYNCHYFSIFDTMPKPISNALSTLLNREIADKIEKDRALIKKNSTMHDNDVKYRLEQAVAMEKRNNEDKERLHEALKYSDFVNLGKALDKVAEGLGEAFALGFQKGMHRGNFGGW